MKKLIAILFMTVISASAHATIVQAFAPADLGPGPFTLENFEDGVFESGAVYSSSSGVRILSAASASGSVTPSGVNGLSTNSFPDPIKLTFSSATSSVGLFFGNDDTCCAASFTAFLDIFDLSGLIGTIGVTANMNDFADQFLGFTSDEMVTSVVVRYGSGSDVGLFHYIDDVRFNLAPNQVPEPTTLSILALGLAGLGFARRKVNA